MGSTLNKVAKAAALSLATVAFTSTASAQSLEGFYAGAFIQNDFGKAPGTGLDGALGVWAGYNYGVGNGFIVGAEAEVQYDWATSVVPAGSAFTGLLNARAGYAFSDSFMLYGKGGAGFMSGAGLVYDFGVGGEAAFAGNYMVRGEVVRVMGAGMTRNRTDFKVGVGYKF
jgi:opacity protein-like surface antigen